MAKKAKKAAAPATDETTIIACPGCGHQSSAGAFLTCPACGHALGEPTPAPEPEPEPDTDDDDDNGDGDDGEEE